jgi:hypothetical protein
MTYLFKRVDSKEASEPEIDAVFALMKDHNVSPDQSWIRRSYTGKDWNEKEICDLRIDLGYNALYLKEELFKMGWRKEG